MIATAMGAQPARDVFIDILEREIFRLKVNFKSSNVYIVHSYRHPNMFSSW